MHIQVNPSVSLIHKLDIQINQIKTTTQEKCRNENNESKIYIKIKEFKGSGFLCRSRDV